MCCSKRIVTTDDGTRLFVRQYGRQTTGGPCPGSASARHAFRAKNRGDDEESASGPRTVILIHGGFEHGERYEHLARWMAERGWNVVLPDLRGHGRSEGVPMHVRNFGDYVRDLEAIRTELRLPSETTAVFGHSMGALISLRHSQLLPGRVAALVLACPLLAVRVPVSPFKTVLGRAVSYIAPKTRFRSPLNPGDATRNQEVIESRLRDPLFHRSVTASWYFSMKSALRTVWEDADKIGQPLLVLQAGEDRIVDPVAAESWLKGVGSADTTYRFFPNHFHELHHEPDWEDTAASILNWLDERINRSVPRSISSHVAE